MTPNLSRIRQELNEAIETVESANQIWSEAVTSLHLADINLRKAQKKMRECYNQLHEKLEGNIAH